MFDPLLSKANLSMQLLNLVVIEKNICLSSLNGRMVYIYFSRKTIINVHIPKNSEENTFLVWYCLKLSSKDLDLMVLGYICKLGLIVSFYS